MSKDKLQPFGERLQSLWVTSVSEAIAHGSVWKNPFQRANNTESTKVGSVLFLYGERDSNKGGLSKDKLQPFGERLQSPWVTSVSEAIAHGSVWKNPFQRAKRENR